MKILHINDMAGVAGVLVKYLRKAGHQADLISFMDDHEFGFCKFYKGKHFQDQDIMRHVLAGAIPQYDIIHLHFSYPLLPALYKFNKPVVMHYHGTEIALSHADARMFDYKAHVLVAGEQLLQHHPRAEHLPTIVDTEHFKPMEGEKKGNFTFKIPYLKDVKVEGLDIETVDRATGAIPYSELPKFLNHWAGYVDVRHHKTRGLLTDRSKTALEALACGLRVLTEKGEWITELPEQHKPENVVVQLIEYYEGLL